MAGKRDIKVDQGSKKVITAWLKNSNGTPYDLTGYEGIGQVRETTASEDVIAAFDVEVTALEGKVTSTLGATALNGLSLPGPRHDDRTELSFDIKVYKPGDPEADIRILNGTLLVSPGTTRG